ncbi:MAG TPA: double zinc ribbon domain-containing protein [Candidatus Humimicrobiaceae bacterium]
MIQKIPQKVNINFINILKDIFVPPLCTVCGKAGPELLCRQCMSKINEIGDKVCNYCGRPLSRIDPERKMCSFCKNEDFNFYRHRSFTTYEGEIRKIIRKYKYKKIYDLKEVITGFLERAYFRNYKDEKIDYMDTVPGEHMEILCRSLSGLIKIPFAGNILSIKKIIKQQGLDYMQRKSNIEEAFKVKNCMLSYGKNILLVDDVWTTGSTLVEISGILKRAGADRIYLLTIARGK